jgi:UPF0716 protein FxsA
LLTPGVFTDIIGFACLIPSVRKKIAQTIIEKRLVGVGGVQRPFPQNEADVIEGEFRKEDKPVAVV